MEIGNIKSGSVWKAWLLFCTAKSLQLLPPVAQSLPPPRLIYFITINTPVRQLVYQESTNAITHKAVGVTPDPQNNVKQDPAN